VPGSTILDIPPHEQEWLRAELRQARYGDLLALHVLLLCAAGRTPTEIAAFLFCSRSSVYRIVAAYTAQGLADLGAEPPAAGAKRAWLSPSLRHSLLALLKKGPSAYGGCRTRWSCAPLAVQLRIQRGIPGSASTMRRWRHGLGWGWKRAQLVARAADPERIEKLAHLRHTRATQGKRAVRRFADELDIHLLPKVGYQWMPRGETVKIVTPGQNQQYYLAGALEPKSGRSVACPSPRKTTLLFRTLLDHLEELYPKTRFDKVSVVVDTYGIPKAKAVERWLAEHPRFELLFLPTYCPQANPIERAFGDVHDKCTRNHKRQRLEDLVSDVECHLLANGPWKYKLSQLYYTPEVTAAVGGLTAEPQLPQAA
jgi:transposase